MELIELQNQITALTEQLADLQKKSSQLESDNAELLKQNTLLFASHFNPSAETSPSESDEPRPMTDEELIDYFKPKKG